MCTPVTPKGYKKNYRYQQELPQNHRKNASLREENLIPKLVGRDNISHHFRDIASLPLIVGSLNIELSSDYEKFLECSMETSSVFDTYDPLTAISEQKKIYTKTKTLKPK